MRCGFGLLASILSLGRRMPTVPNQRWGCSDFVSSLPRQRKGEHRATLRSVLRPDTPLVGGDDLAADRQPQSSPSGAGLGLARLDELIKDRL